MRVFAFVTAVLALTMAMLVGGSYTSVLAQSSSPIAPVTVGDVSEPTDDTINDFYPEQRSLTDCLSSVPKPDCGGGPRGGWRQALVLIAILAGLAVIGWRIVAQSRKARR